MPQIDDDTSKNETDNGKGWATRQAVEQASKYGIGFVLEDEFGQFKSLDPRKVAVIRPSDDEERKVVQWDDENVKPVT